MKKFDEILITKRINNYVWNKLFVTAKEKKFLSDILKDTDVMIFGGVIREFVFNNFQKVDHRDIDLVIVNKSKNIEDLLNKYLLNRNSFGGYKLKIDNKDIDIWEFNTTWAIKNQYPLFYSMTEFLPNTSFFNINAVVFSIGKNKLLASDGFIKFFEDEVLDIEFGLNPLPSLCLIKTFEYHEKYKLKLSPSIKNYITKNFKDAKLDLTKTQIKHYGKIKYSEIELNKFFSKIVKAEKNNAKHD